ncbi:sigma-70 family RNA polymerase sigma factor [Flagellimonas sp. DF-77]|uniref:RNA polymerase sigma factor n=1 Tax=Flagellimonas algarum TaxID=3230298 RepID=UPI003392A699
MNPLNSKDHNDAIDKKLIKRTLDGEKSALNELIERHQPFVYNIAWKMVGDPTNAADLSQEALIKMISNLGKFNFQSSFRTWAYRIVRNHFLNDQKNSARKFASNFKELGAALDSIPDIELTEEEKLDKSDETKEIRLTCLSGMLLCLTKEQRMIYIIGEMFRANHTIGSEIMEMSKANFRMKLSKARRDLINFMQSKCGLIDKTNPCRCHKKVTVSIEGGIIDSKNLLQNRKEFSTFRNELEEDANYLSDDSELKYLELHLDHSFKTNFAKKNFLTQLLEDADWKNRLNLN